MTREELQAALAVCERATAGLWFFDSYNTVFSGSGKTHDLCEIVSIPDEPITDDDKPVDKAVWYPQSANNAQFIAITRDPKVGYEALLRNYDEAMRIRRESHEHYCPLCDEDDAEICPENVALQNYYGTGGAPAQEKEPAR